MKPYPLILRLVRANPHYVYSGSIMVAALTTLGALRGGSPLIARIALMRSGGGEFDPVLYNIVIFHLSTGVYAFSSLAFSAALSVIVYIHSNARHAIFNMALSLYIALPPINSAIISILRGGRAYGRDDGWQSPPDYYSDVSIRVAVWVIPPLIAIIMYLYAEFATLPGKNNAPGHSS